MVEGCEECARPREICAECHREIANEHDEGIHNTGACGCKEARALCWRRWHRNDECRQYSVYNPKYGTAQ